MLLVSHWAKHMQCILVFVTPFVQAVQGNADDSPEQEGLGATLPLLAERECTQTV